MASYLDPYREAIEKALAKDVPVSHIAKAIKVPRSTLTGFIDSWGYETRGDTNEAELEALRRLVNG